MPHSMCSCQKTTYRTCKKRCLNLLSAAAQVPVGPVLSLDEVFGDAQVRHNDCVVEREHPTAGKLREVRPGAHFGGTIPELPPIAPLKGEQTAEILSELGISAEELEELKSEDVLGP